MEVISIDDLAPVDEFHIGGRIATREFLEQLGIDSSCHVLDVGCGIGGAARFSSVTYGCQVTGIDLTPEYIDTGNQLCRHMGHDKKVRLKLSNATSLAEADATYDCAYMLHVGMNIQDKQSLASELYRVLRPGAMFGIYDVMRVGEGELVFPVPWAESVAGSSVDTVETYIAAFELAGFGVVAVRNRREFALSFFQQLKARATNAKGPPPLGLHILMGPQASGKVKNMVDNISRNFIAPVELIARKPR